MSARALSAWVSQRSVRASISLRSCSHSSRFGLPSRPAHTRGEEEEEDGGGGGGGGGEDDDDDDDGDDDDGGDDDDEDREE